MGVQKTKYFAYFAFGAILQSRTKLSPHGLSGAAASLNASPLQAVLQILMIAPSLELHHLHLQLHYLGTVTLYLSTTSLSWNCNALSIYNFITINSNKLF